MEINDASIERFWQWFVKNEITIKECIENEHSEQKEYVIDQMNEHILNMGVLTWDVGLNDDDNWFLMLSPNGNPEMLEVSEAIMEAAPDHMGWLFYASRPAKNWNRQFVVFDEYMDEQFIDASEWNYVLFEEDEDGLFELLLEAKNTLSFDAETAESAAEQFVVQEVGEAIRIRFISTIEIVHTVEAEYDDSKASVAELMDHLSENQ